MPEAAHTWPEWRGEPLEGRLLLVWPEQGFGDQIMYARFAKDLADKGANVTLFCSPALSRTFAALDPEHVISASRHTEFPDPDYWVMSGHLAGRAGYTLETIPRGGRTCAPSPLGAGVLASSGRATHSRAMTRAVRSHPRTPPRYYRSPARSVLNPRTPGRRTFRRPPN